MNSIRNWTQAALRLFIVALAFMSGPSLAVQAESPVACDEGVVAEPIALAYGDHTSGCAINPAVDADRFTFVGAAGDQVRVNIHGMTALFDPSLEIRNPVGAVIGGSSCTGNAFGCSFQVDIELVASGSFQLAISDAGTNEIGNYNLQLERLVPSTSTVRLDYDSSEVDAIDPTSDVDHFHFNATAGTDVRINVFGATALFDPAIEVRDPNGAVVINSIADGAACTGSAFGCSFSVDLSPTVSGDYSIVLYDFGTNEVGNYQISLWCLFGPCESVAGVPDPDAPLLSYDEPIVDAITPAADGDPFTFNGIAGTDIRINVFGATALFDPAIEVRDPNGNVVINSIADGAACTGSAFGCSFSVDLSPPVSGDYSVILYDFGTNEIGNYQISLWCIFGPCESVAGVPDPGAPLLSYVEPIVDAIMPAADGDPFTFNGTAGTDIRINVFGATALFDPAIEVRDPNGNVVINSIADGAACTGSAFGCSFSVDLSPPVSGDYSVILYDFGTNEIGNYQISLWCIFGACDSDADGVPDGDRSIINYGDNLNDVVSPAVDGDFYTFAGTAGDQIRLNVLGATALFDPTLECRDPNGTLVLDGVADGAACTGNAFGCSFSVDVLPAITGAYECVIYDTGVNEVGNYELGLQCLFGTCSDIDPPLMCGDNCTLVANPDQRDTNGDGFGNICDADLNNDGVTNFLDLGQMKSVFFSNDPDADLNGDGSVNFIDLGIMKSRFFGMPGPSCAVPNNP